MDLSDNDKICLDKRKYLNQTIDNLDQQKIDQLFDFVTRNESKDNYASIWGSVKDKVAASKQAVVVGSSLAAYSFSTAIIISTIVVLLLIPVVYSSVTGWMGSTSFWLKLVIIWIFLIAVIYIIEMVVINYLTS